MKVVITPSTLYVPGTAQRILAEIGSGPVQVDGTGKVHAELNAGQLDLFRLKGAAHAVQIVDESAPAVESAAATFPEPETEPDKELTITIETAPGVRQTMKVGPQGLEPIAAAHTPVAAANTPVAGSQETVKGSEKSA